MTLPDVKEPAGLNVSRETLERLITFQSLVKKWTPKINLISKSTVPDIWTRHTVDSIQVFRAAPLTGHWVDMGSGGGFPGLVVAILAQEIAPDLRVTLIESDTRKSVFLRTAVRETGANCVVLNDRIETIAPLKADIVSARALTDIHGLFCFCERHLIQGGVGLFPKGSTWQAELDSAKQDWTFSCEAIKSITDPDAVILKVKGISRV